MWVVETNIYVILQLFYNYIIHQKNYNVRYEHKYSEKKTIKNVVFWDVAPCTPFVTRRFGETYGLHLQGRNIRERGARASKRLRSQIHSSETSVHKRSTRHTSQKKTFFIVSAVKTSTLTGKQSFTDTDLYKILDGIRLREPWTFVEITVCETDGILTEQLNYTLKGI
jgi:hypothetical protein